MYIVPIVKNAQISEFIIELVYCLGVAKYFL